VPFLEIFIFFEETPLPHLSQIEKELESPGFLIRLQNAALDLSGKWHTEGVLELLRGRDDITCYCSAQSR
jgi:hypothetical protein